MSENKKIIFDTDIGDDIDDALALLLLLKFNNVQLIGVTTVFRNAPLRARIAKKILKLAGFHDVPVYAGHGDPLELTADKEASFVQYTADLENAEFRADNHDVRNGDEAVDFILEAANKYGNDLTVLGIGPYTNIAKAYLKSPEVLKKSDIVLMGGCFYEQFIEYNVAMDPQACDVLMEADLNLTFVSADVTWKAQLNDEQTSKVLSIYNDGLSGYCAELVRLWKKNCWFNPVLHDPLAAYFVIDGSICNLEEVWAATELKGEHTRGLTINLDHCFKYLEQKTPDKKRILCTKSVDADRFIEIFLNKTFEIR